MYQYSSLSPRFFQVEFDEEPMINFTTKKTMYIGWKLKDEEHNLNVITDAEFAKLQDYVKIGSTDYPEYFVIIEDAQDRNYVVSKIKAKYVQATEVEKFDYSMKLKIYSDVYDIIEDRFTVTNPCIVYKDGTAKVSPGNSRTYFITEDLAYQLQKKLMKLIFNYKVKMFALIFIQKVH